MTSRYIEENDEKGKQFLEQLLTKQQITMISTLQLYYRDNSPKTNPIFYSDSDKSQKYRRLNWFSKKYHGVIATSGDCNFLVGRVINLMEYSDKKDKIISKISDYINKRIKINTDELEIEFGLLDENILTLIDSYNEGLSSSIEVAIDEYTKVLVRERDELKKSLIEISEELKRLEQIIANQESTIANQKSTIATLTEKNNESENKLAKIRTIVG